MAETLEATARSHRVGRLRALLLGTAALAGVGVVAIEAPAWSEVQPPPANANVAPIPEDGYADLAAAVMPAVVNVSIERDAAAGDSDGDEDQQGPMSDPDMRRFFERFFGQQMPRGGHPQPQQQQPRHVMGEGSGFIVSPDGLIVTNFHVAGEADKIEVTLKDGTKYKATRKGADQKSDLALIKIDAKQPLPYVTWGDSDKVRPGQRVVAVGNPFGLGGTVTAGIVSAVGREIGSGPYDDFLQIDAPINRGNSGGPTFNTRGEVIGVNTAIFSPSGGSVGIGFAIASNQAKNVIEALERSGKVERGFMGVGIQGVDEDLARALKLDKPKGALVSKVEDNSPAAKAGIRRGDVILQFDGKPIDKVTQLSRYVAATQAGKAADVTLWRDGKQESVKVDVALMPGKDQQVASNDQEDDQADASQQPRLGLSLAPLTRDTREQLGIKEKVDGVVVTQVQPDSPADQKGLQPGDIIMSVDQKAVKDPKQVADALKKARADGDQTVLLLIMRNGQQIFEAVPLAAS
jgi:serine protease Do